MSPARDRYDAGKKIAEAKLERLQAIVRQGNQRECEHHTLSMALESPDRHVPGTLAYELVTAYAAERSA